MTNLRRWLRRSAWGLIAGFVVLVLFGDFIAPYDHTQQIRNSPASPPSRIRFVDVEGRIHVRPFIYRTILADPLSRTYAEDTSTRSDISFFVPGEGYALFGLVPARTHLFGLETAAPDIRINVLGTDDLGRDRFSRLIQAIRFSLIVAPLGAFLAWLIGFAVGLVSGYSGRRADSALMGIADTMLALPALILILAARAAFPLELPPFRAAVLLILIFALTGWAEIARITRSLVRSIKEQEFVLAAKCVGLSDLSIVIRHILPNALPAIVRQGLVVLPYFLLAEAALSFLGVGVQEPAPSLGNLLAAAADINRLQREPFLVLAPGIVIALFMLAVRLLGSSLDRNSKITF
jgi:peptide/nickel transport system permease protein